jgi:hypothetical protein
MGKKYDPTPKDRSAVETMAAFGIPQDEIARALKMSGHTLREHFRDELESAATKANASVAKSLFLNATERNNVTAQIFWLKCRSGWKEAAQDVNLNGRVVHAGRADLTGLSDAELLILERILDRRDREARAIDAAAVPATSQG